MTRTTSLVPLLAALLLPTAAQAAWPVRTVATGGPAFDRAVLGLPGGAVATVFERGTSGTRTLELRVGSRRTVLDTSTHTFAPVDLQADARGRLVGAWLRVVGGARGKRRVVVWTGSGHATVLPPAPSSASWMDLAVAPDGTAVVAWSAGTVVRVAWRRPGGRFGTPRIVPGLLAGRLSAGIADDGTATIAVENTPGLQAVRLAPGTATATPVTLTSANGDGHALGVTASGDAVLAVKTVARPGGSLVRTVSVARWDADAATPRPLAPVSTQPGAGEPRAIVRGERVVVVFKEAASIRDQAAALVGVAVGPDGVPGVTANRVRAGATTSPVSLAPSGAGLRAYVRADGRVRSVFVDARGKAGAVSTVTGGDDQPSSVTATEAGGRPVAVWTRRLGPTNRDWRVRLARP